MGKQLGPTTYQLRRKQPWLHWHAASGFAVRVLECTRCGAREQFSLKQATVNVAAGIERRFTAAHRTCEEPK